MIKEKHNTTYPHIPHGMRKSNFTFCVDTQTEEPMTSTNYRMDQHIIKNY
uniref:Uncharacterized protein n=1 Tax=Arion vulgaris TaxID=1028688 RepID=A0A0B7A824_9EUPU